MKPNEFLKEIDKIAAEFRGRAFIAEILIGQVVTKRMQHQDSISRDELRTELETLLSKYKGHPGFSKAISEALQKL